MLLKMNLNVRRNSSKTEIISERGKSVKKYTFILSVYLLSFLTLLLVIAAFVIGYSVFQIACFQSATLSDNTKYG